MLSFFSKNIQKFLVFFFTATSLVLVVMGVSRIKKPSPVAETPIPTPPLPVDTAGATTITGAAYQTEWGNTVARISVKDGKVIAVSMPSVPNSPPSLYAEPFLVDQALKAGSANIQGVSGATYTSIAFKSSLENAIAKASAQGQEVNPNIVPADTTPTAKPSVPRKYRDEDDDWGDDDWDD